MRFRCIQLWDESSRRLGRLPDVNWHLKYAVSSIRQCRIRPRRSSSFWPARDSQKRPTCFTKTTKHQQHQ